ncbi:MAG: hypothetical protein ACRBN8_19150 [Nannocystales bacterium]
MLVLGVVEADSAVILLDPRYGQFCLVATQGYNEGLTIGPQLVAQPSYIHEPPGLGKVTV